MRAGRRPLWNGLAGRPWSRTTTIYRHRGLARLAGLSEGELRLLLRVSLAMVAEHQSGGGGPPPRHPPALGVTSANVYVRLSLKVWVCASHAAELVRARWELGGRPACTESSRRARLLVRNQQAQKQAPLGPLPAAAACPKLRRASQPPPPQALSPDGSRRQRGDRSRRRDPRLGRPVNPQC